VIQILGYDSSAVYTLTLAQTPGWQQQTGSWLWLHGTAANSSELEEIGCLFGFHRQQLEGCRQPGHVAFVDAYHRYIYAALPFLEEEQERDFRLFLGRNFLVTLSSAPATAVDIIWPRYQSEVRLWAHGPDYLLHLLIQALVDDSANAVERVNRVELPGEHPPLPSPAGGPLPTALAFRNVQDQLLRLRYWTANQLDVVTELAQLEHELIDANVRHQLHHSRRRLAGLRRWLEWQQEAFQLQSASNVYLAAGQAKARLERLALILPALLALILVLLIGIFLALLLS
jgi:magnesium transporter